MKVFASAPGICILYCVTAALAIIAFRLFVPGEAAPLPVFSFKWKLIRGLVDALTMYPAILLSALIIPFGLIYKETEMFAPFSRRFLELMRQPILTAIAGSVVYVCLFFLFSPLAADYEASLRYQGTLYRRARANVEKALQDESWDDASRFLSICDRIWPENPELAAIRAEVAASRTPYTIQHESENTDEAAAAESSESPPPLTMQRPVRAVEAFSLAREALAAGRYYDAHWLAGLGAELSAPGSAERTIAAQLRSEAANKIAEQEATAAERKSAELYRRKKAAYEAMTAGNWIEAYYSFQDLVDDLPKDPDIENFLRISGEGLSRMAFFLDEFEEALVNVQIDALFSLRADPVLNGREGRLVMRVSELSVFADYAYGTELSLMAFDTEGKPLWDIEAPCVKFTPVSLNGVSRVSLLTLALDRANRGTRKSPTVTLLGGSKNVLPPGVSPLTENQALLNISWDKFVLMSEARQGIDHLSPVSLYRAAKHLGDSGFLPQVFQAELIYRFAEALLLLPLAIFALVIGWRYRALARSRYMLAPMFAILPVVFNAIVLFYRGFINHFGIWAVVNLGFAAAASVFAFAGAALLLVTLFLLAAQRG
ncbi:MAG: hypothetical protein LBR16_02475 [Treponema sp.]|jgi:hypothetical protein|nr:hypothetical protein [Treponema sp.]